MASMCDTCHAGCCRAYHLFITVFDAIRISQDLSLPIGEFVTMVPQDAAGVKRLGPNVRPLRFSDPGLEDSFLFIALKRVESRLVPGTLKCYFLQEWTRQDQVSGRGDHPGAKIAGRCGIYGSRPLMCRTYPSILHPNGALGFIGNPKPAELAKSNAIYTLCPEKWQASSFGSDTTTVVHSLALHHYEVEFQNKLIDEWNTAPRSLKEFFPYAIASYGNRFRQAPEDTPEAVGAARAALPESDPSPLPE